MRTTNLRHVIPQRAQQIAAYRAEYEEDGEPLTLTITLHDDPYATRPRRFLTMARMASATRPSDSAVFTYTGRRLHEASSDYAASLRTAQIEAVAVEVLA